MIVPFPVQARPFDAGRLITDQMAVRALLRHYLQAEATRLACCFWWPTHELRDAQVEMRLALSRLLVRARVGREMDSDTRAFADAVLADAIDRIDVQHDEHWHKLCAVGEATHRTGAGRAEVAAAVVAAARPMLPLPPPWLVRDAAGRCWATSQVQQSRHAPRRPTRGYRRHG